MMIFKISKLKSKFHFSMIVLSLFCFFLLSFSIYVSYSYNLSYLIIHRDICIYKSYSYISMSLFWTLFSTTFYIIIIHNETNADSIDFSSINDICISHSTLFHFISFIIEHRNQLSQESILSHVHIYIVIWFRTEKFCFFLFQLLYTCYNSYYDLISFEFYK